MKTQLDTTETKIIEVHDLNILGETIQAYRGSDNFLYVSVSMLCNILQLNPDDELCHIQSHAFLREGIVNHQSAGTNKYMILMRLNYLALWLAYVDSSKINNETRREVEDYQKGASIILYQAICSGEISNFEALAMHLDQTDLLFKAYKEAVGLVGIVRTKILKNIKS